ncbi:MAG: tetratricopeptide repeat protein [Rhodospirillaceae bacterium]|nr:tetratricopeptide repeat protein [Rhodospirillaceae bacterium]
MNRFLCAAALLLAGCAANPHRIGDVTEARALSDKGFAMFEAGDYMGAKTALDAVIAYGSIDDKDYTRRAAVYGALKDYERALADNDKALALDPNAWRTHNQRAMFHQRLAQYDAAIADLDVAYRAAPTQLDLLRRRAYLKVVAGRFKDAIEDYDMLADTGAQKAAGILGRGVSLYLDGHWREAADVFTGILQKDPGDGLTAYWLGKASLRAGLPIDLAHFGVHDSKDPSWVMADVLLTSDTIEDATAKIAPLETRGTGACEIQLFYGIWRVLRAGGTGGTPAFQAAEKRCPADSIEASEARVELGRLFAATAGN